MGRTLLTSHSAMARSSVRLAGSARLHVSTLPEGAEKRGNSEPLILECSSHSTGLSLTNSLSYLEMCEVMEEALHRLYWACQTGSGFPGTVPPEIEENGAVTTTAILESMGLSPPTLEDSPFPQEPNNAAASQQPVSFPERQSFGPSGATTQGPLPTITSPVNTTMTVSAGPPPLLSPESSTPASYPLLDHGYNDYLSGTIPLRAAPAPAAAATRPMVYAPVPVQSHASVAGPLSVPHPMLPLDTSVLSPLGHTASHPGHFELFGHVNNSMYNATSYWTGLGAGLPFRPDSYDGADFST